MWTGRVGFRHSWRKTEAAQQDRASGLSPMLRWEWKGTSPDNLYFNCLDLCLFTPSEAQATDHLLCLVLPHPSASSCTASPLSIFLSPDLFSGHFNWKLHAHAYKDTSSTGSKLGLVWRVSPSPPFLLLPSLPFSFLPLAPSRPFFPLPTLFPPLPCTPQFPLQVGPLKSS